VPTRSATSHSSPRVFGFRDFTAQARWDAAFLAVPDPVLAREHMRRLTEAPHWASSPEDYATALYVAGRFQAAGLATEIVPYRVLLNKPTAIHIEAFDASGRRVFSGPTPEHVDSASPARPVPYQDDPRILPGFNGSSPSGDVTAPVVYANFGRLADFRRLAQLGIGVKGKIVLVRYGADFRGVKVYIAQQYGASGVLIFSDPSDSVDDGGATGLPYPAGPNRPGTAVQRGSVQFLPIYPGDPQTPGIASTPDLPDSQRLPLDKLQYDLPSIPVQPLSSADAASILRSMIGPEAAHEWQGGLDLPYRLGSNVTVHMHLEQDAHLRTIWDVIGRIPGASEPGQWVVAGNHRDAWVYGAADPASGTAAMLEAVHGLGVLLHQGWRPRRTIVVASWDAEEEGLVGSTEWAEQHAAELAHAVAYFNTDVAVSGPDFQASAVPSLRQFVREIAREVPSPGGPVGATVYSRWRRAQAEAGIAAERHTPSPVMTPPNFLQPDEMPSPEPGLDADSLDLRIGNLGSGSDYTPFLQHLGVPATDIGSEGPFGVYHTVYDNFDWFTRFADPSFAYVQQQARVFGLQILHMADADVLPLDYGVYATEIRGYLDTASHRAGAHDLNLDFSAATTAARRFAAAATAVRTRQEAPPANPAAAATLNRCLRAVERDLLLPVGLPRRPWYRHAIYAPGEFTGYAAVVLPGVNEAIDAGDGPRAAAQLQLLTQALDRAAATLTAALR
jgi:N-acetylated-alpha-linked acidic dipeptidase